MKALDIDELLPRLVDQLDNLTKTEGMEFAEEQIPCEAPNHAAGGWGHDKGPATHYAQVWHECFYEIPDGSVVAICAEMTAMVIANANIVEQCMICGKAMPFKQFMSVLGPIGKV